MCAVWLFDVIRDQHTNLGWLFKSFTIGILICILKAKWVYSQAIFIFIYLFLPRTYTLIIQTYELDVRRGEGRGNTDVRDRRASGSEEGSQKLTKSQYFGSS